MPRHLNGESRERIDDVIERLRHFCRTSYITETTLAREVGVSESALADWLSGKYRPLKLDRIEAFLNHHQEPEAESGTTGVCVWVLFRGSLTPNPNTVSGLFFIAANRANHVATINDYFALSFRFHSIVSVVELGGVIAYRLAP